MGYSEVFMQQKATHFCPIHLHLLNVLLINDHVKFGSYVQFIKETNSTRKRFAVVNILLRWFNDLF